VTAVLGQGIGIGQGAVSGLARVANSAIEVGNFNRWRNSCGTVNQCSSLWKRFARQAGIVTEDESLTSHAAIIGLRLGVPVIVGVKNATQIIRDGAILTLDTHRGLVYSGAMGANSAS
jgi:pyruvate kinase